jgi:hypothetical protein
MDGETYLWCKKHRREVGIDEFRYRCSNREGGKCEQVDIIPHKRWAKSPKRRGPHFFYKQNILKLIKGSGRSKFKIAISYGNDIFR